MLKVYLNVVGLISLMVLVLGFVLPFMISIDDTLVNIVGIIILFVVYIPVVVWWSIKIYNLIFKKGDDNA